LLQCSITFTKHRKDLENLLHSANKKLIIRTLVDENTHLSKHLYTDDFDSFGNPINFVFQNTYSFKYISKLIKKYRPEAKFEFIEDIFNSKKLDKEGKEWEKKQSSTRVINNLQIAGNKVFKWYWIICFFES